MVWYLCKQACAFEALRDQQERPKVRGEDRDLQDGSRNFLYPGFYARGNCRRCEGCSPQGVGK